MDEVMLSHADEDASGRRPGSFRHTPQGDLARGQRGLSRGVSGAPKAGHASDKHERRRRHAPAPQTLS
jgi:hypothetical protein